jgi:hypothetical protein
MTKVFTPGEVLTASDVNEFLVNPPPTGTGNAIINGAFDIWQRGTSFTNPAAGRTADRFVASQGLGGTATTTRETFTPGAAPLAGVESEFYLRINQTAEGTESFNLSQFIEDVRTFAGQTVTVSFYARVSTGTHQIEPQFVQRFGSGGSDAVLVANETVTATTSWQRFSTTISVPSISGKTIGAGSSLQLRFGVGTATVKAYEYWGIQVEAGTVATPFKRNANSLQGELAACQRYFVRFGSGTFDWLGLGSATSTTAAKVLVPLPVTPRVPPTSMSSGGNLALTDGVNTVGLNAAPVLFIPSIGQQQLNLTVASGLTQFRPYALLQNNDATSFIAFNMEL